MDDLVVGQREGEVLAEGVDTAERELALVEPAVYRLPGEVLEGVVHPAHVPLEPEADATKLHRLRHPGERGRLFGEDLHVRMVQVDSRVELTEEGDRVEILPASVGVGEPFARPPRIVEVEHRRDRVDPQAVDVVRGEPVFG